MSILGKKLKDITNKITNFANNVRIYAVDDVGGANTDSYIDPKDITDLIDTNTADISTINSKFTASFTGKIEFTDSDGHDHTVNISTGLITNWSIIT